MINCNIHFEFDEYTQGDPLPFGEEIQGKMIITPFESAEGLEVGFELIAEIQGDTQPMYKTVQKEIIANSVHFTSGLTYTYPFSFKNTLLETHRDKTITIKVRLQAVVKKPGEKVSFLEELFEIGPRKQAIYLQFYRKNPQYLIQPEIPPLRKNSAPMDAYVIGTGALFVVLGTLSFHLFKLSIWDVLNLGFLLVIFIIVYFAYKNMVVGKLEIELSKLHATDFQVTLYNEKHWNQAKSLKIWFEVIEKAWHSGSESGGYFETKIYTSEKIKHFSPIKAPQATFSYPPKKPTSQTFGNIFIYCKVKVRILSNYGIPYTISGLFQVVKV